MPQCCPARGGWEGVGWHKETVGTNSPTRHRAVALCWPRVIESLFLSLTSRFGDPGGGGNMREVIEAISVTVMSVCFLPSASPPGFLICCGGSHTQNGFLFKRHVRLVLISGGREGVRVQLLGRPANDGLH